MGKIKIQGFTDADRVPSGARDEFLFGPGGCAYVKSGAVDIECRDGFAFSVMVPTSCENVYEFAGDVLARIGPKRSP